MKIVRMAMGMLVSAGLLAGAGCNIIGPAAYFAMGEPDIPPVFTLDPARPTVIFVDNRANQITQRTARGVIGQTCEQALLDSGACKRMVQSRAVEAVVKSERFSRPMGIAEVGEAVGAEVVIYASVDGFTLTPDGTSFIPTCVMRVKVVDVTTRGRLFPPLSGDQEWFPLNVTIPQQAANVPTNNAARADAEQALARRAGRDLGFLFYAHQPLHGDHHLNERP